MEFETINIVFEDHDVDMLTAREGAIAFIEWWRTKGAAQFEQWVSGKTVFFLDSRIADEDLPANAR